jgi:hypothetical protein
MSAFERALGLSGGAVYPVHVRGWRAHLRGLSHKPDLVPCSIAFFGKSAQREDRLTVPEAPSVTAVAEIFQSS